MNRVLVLKILSLSAPAIILISSFHELFFEWYGRVSGYLFYTLNFPKDIGVLWTLSNIFSFVAFISCVVIFVKLLQSEIRVIKFLAPLSFFSYFLSRLFKVLQFRFGGNWDDYQENGGTNWHLIEHVFVGVRYFNFDFYSINDLLRGVILLLILASLVAIVLISKIEILQKVSPNSFIPSQVAEISTPKNLLTNPKGSSMDSNAQWKVKLPGQSDQSVDTATLQMWARSGVIRPDTLIQDDQNGMTYSASQIPSIFSSKSYVTALLLSFFIGYLGIDRFYLGHTGLGIGKLLTFGGCGIWALIDFILIAMRKVTDSQGNPLA